MSKTEGFLSLDSQNAATIGEKFPEIAEREAKPRPQGGVRKKLADISNLPQNQRLLTKEKLQSIDTATKEFIDQLQKFRKTWPW